MMDIIAEIGNGMGAHLWDQAEGGRDGELAYEFKVICEFHGMFCAQIQAMPRLLKIRPSNSRQFQESKCSSESKRLLGLV